MTEYMANPDSEEVLIQVPVGLIYTIIKYLELGLVVSMRNPKDDETIKNFIQSLKTIVDADGLG